MLLISSLLISAQSETSFELAEDDIDVNEFIPGDWLKTADVSWVDHENEDGDVQDGDFQDGDIEDENSEIDEWNGAFSMRSGPPSEGVTPKPITLDIYYESMCPYSVKYIINQVEPACLTLKDYVHVNFIPFGNAKVKTGPDGNVEIQCQHGLNECIGNKIHACGMRRLATNGEQIRYVSCVMKFADQKIGGQNCSAPYGLVWEEIESCSEGAEGDALHYHYGQITMSVTPRINGVPKTAINKFPWNDTDPRVVENLFGVLCQKLREMFILPRECGFRFRSAKN